MITDKAGSEDDLQYTLGEMPESLGTPVALKPLKKRPTKSASRDEWAEYCVSLGASEQDINHTTQHFEGTHPVSSGLLEKLKELGVKDEVLDQLPKEQTGEMRFVELPALTKAELIQLADRLEG